MLVCQGLEGSSTAPLLSQWPASHSKARAHSLTSPPVSPVISLLIFTIRRPEEQFISWSKVSDSHITLSISYSKHLQLALVLIGLHLAQVAEKWLL